MGMCLVRKLRDFMGSSGFRMWIVFIGVMWL